MIKFPCPECGTHNEAEDQDAGLQLNCGQCTSPIFVPAPARRAVPAPVRRAVPAPVARHVVEAPLRSYDQPNVQRVQITNPATYYDTPGDWYEHPHNGYRISANRTQMMLLCLFAGPFFIYRYDEKASWLSHLVLYPILIFMLGGLMAVALSIANVPLGLWLVALCCAFLHVLWSVGLVAHTHKKMLMAGWRIV